MPGGSVLPRKAAVLTEQSPQEIKETRRTKGVDVDFHRKGISATKPLVSPIGKSSLSYGGEGSLASRWALELDVAPYSNKNYPQVLHFNFLSNKKR